MFDSSLFDSAPVGSAYFLPVNNVRIGINRGDGQVGTVAVPLPSQVLVGVATDAGQTGNVVLPTEDQVELNALYGPGSVFQGTLDPNGSISVSEIIDGLLAATLPVSPIVGTVGEALVAARAEGFGAWRLQGRALTLYAPDGVTVVRTFTVVLDGNGNAVARL